MRPQRLWAVAADGVYRFTEAPLPEFSPLPKRQVRSPVDWSNPDYILISTDMNRRHFLSGTSWLLVLRGN